MSKLTDAGMYIAREKRGNDYCSVTVCALP